MSVIRVLYLNIPSLKCHRFCSRVKECFCCSITCFLKDNTLSLIQFKLRISFDRVMRYSTAHKIDVQSNLIYVDSQLAADIT